MGVSSNTTWINAGRVIRTEAKRTYFWEPGKEYPDQCVLHILSGDLEFSLFNQTAETLESLGLQILNAAQAQRDEDGRRVATQGYSPTVAEALQHPAEFVEGMTETSAANEGVLAELLRPDPDNHLVTDDGDYPF